MLLYLTRRVLDEQAVEIHEQEVGHQVFGRPTDYDTTADNIVRVHASMLRKRLEQYFDEEGRHETLVLRIPKGNYVPEFQERVLAAAEPEADLAAARRQRQPWIPILAVLCLLLASLSLYLWRQQRPAAATPERTENARVRSFWKQLFTPAHATDVVLNDAALGIYQRLDRQPLSLSHYFDRDYLRALRASAQAAHLPPSSANLLVHARLTSFWNVSILWKLGRLPEVQRARVHLYFARDYSFHALKRHNVILVGNERSNPWIQLFHNRLLAKWSAQAFNSTASADGAIERMPAASARQTHAASFAVSLLSNLAGNGKVLVITSSGGSAANAAISFLTNSAQLIRLGQCLQVPPHTSIFPDFEARFLIQTHAAMPRKIQIANCRKLSG